MNPEKEIFEPVTDATPKNRFQVAVGQECVIAGINCRVRKVTYRDIICRPVDFKQRKE